MKSVEVLSIVAMSLFCLLGLFLLSKDKAWQKGFGWLGIFFLLLAINYLDGILLINGFMLNAPRLAFWEDPLALLYGPLIYFFSLHLKNGAVKREFTTLLHFVPFFLMEAAVLTYHIRFTQLQTQELLSIILSENLDFTFFIGIIPFFAHVIFYILLAQQVLTRHESELKEYYSSVEIKWAFSLVRIILTIFLFSLLATVVQYIGTKEIYSIALMALVLASIFLTLKILLFALNQPMFLSITQPKSSISLKNEEKEYLLEQINSILMEKKLFTNSKLTLKDLAHQIGASERAVSYVINNSMANNFYDLINSYRIEEARQILKNNQDPQLTVLEVLYQVGYNSKSSFNTQFKKKTGLTPSEFKRISENE